jgi:hypothetical protein
MVGTIIGTIICDISTINVRFYLLELRYPHEYCRISHKKNQIVLITHWIVPTSHMMVLISHLMILIE